VVENAVWEVHGAAVYGVVAAAESHLPASKVIGQTCAEQAGRQAGQTTEKPTEGQTGRMDMTVHHKACLGSVIKVSMMLGMMRW